MTNTMLRNVLPCLMIAVGLGLSQVAQAAGYNPVTQQAQSKLATLGHDPGPLDGIAGELFVREKFIQADQFLIHNPAGTDIFVADLRIAHLAIRQSHVEAAGGCFLA